MAFHISPQYVHRVVYFAHFYNCGPKSGFRLIQCKVILSERRNQDGRSFVTLDPDHQWQRGCRLGLQMLLCMNTSSVSVVAEKLSKYSPVMGFTQYLFLMVIPPVNRLPW